MNENEDIDSIEAESISESSNQIESTDTFQPNESETIETPDFGQSIEVKNYSESAETLISDQAPEAEDFQQQTVIVEPEQPAVETAMPTPMVAKDIETPKPVEEVKIEQTPEEVQPEKPLKKHIIKKILLFLLVIILIAAAAFGAYWWRDREAKAFEQTQASNISSLKSELALTNVKLTDALAENATTSQLCDTEIKCVATAPSAIAAENIKASITSSNLAALAGYMASSVTLTLASTGVSETVTPTQAISNIAAFTADATSPWNFSVIASTLSTYSKGTFAKYFTDISIVGKSANNKVISVSFDCDSKISTVFMSSNESLLQ